jgi:hypothetical protein
METLNLEALHKVPEILEEKGSFPRRFGKTEYAIRTIIGSLEVLESETILVLVENEERLKYFESRLWNSLKAEGFNPILNEGLRRIWFKENSNQIKLITVRGLQEHHPSMFAQEKSFNNFIVTDLNNMPSSFYREELTINNIELLNEYSDFLRNGYA